MPWASSPPRPLRALAALQLAEASPLDQPPGANACPRATLLCLRVPSARYQSVSNFNSRPRPNFPFRTVTFSHKVAFPRGRRSDGAHGSSRVPAGTTRHPFSAQPPRPPSPPDPRPWPPTAALREAAATDAPRVLSFCFRSLLSAAGKTMEEQSWGGGTAGEKRVS